MEQEIAGGLGTAGELKVGARECQFRWPVTKEGDRGQRDWKGREVTGLKPKGVSVIENNGGII